MQRSSPRSKGSKLQLGLPSLGVLHGKDEAPEHLALKTSRFRIRTIQVIVGNTDSTLAGHTQNLTCSGSQGALGEEASSGTLADLGEPPGEAGGT